MPVSLRGAKRRCNRARMRGRDCIAERFHRQLTWFKLNFDDKNFRPTFPVVLPGRIYLPGPRSIIGVSEPTHVATRNGTLAVGPIAVPVTSIQSDHNHRIDDLNQLQTNGRQGEILVLPRWNKQTARSSFHRLRCRDSNKIFLECLSWRRRDARLDSGGLPLDSRFLSLRALAAELL